jgi:hypothetical protein
MTEKKLTTCYRFPNGMVMAFDQNGEQMPEYQGRYWDVCDKIRHDYPDMRIQMGAWTPAAGQGALKP